MPRPFGTAPRLIPHAGSRQPRVRLPGTSAPHVGRTATQLAVLMLCASGAHAQPPEQERPPEASIAPLSLSAISQEEHRRQPLIIGTETGSPLGFALECPLCAGRDGSAPSPTSNAPWSAGVGTSFTVAGARVGVAVSEAATTACPATWPSHSERQSTSRRSEASRTHTSGVPPARRSWTSEAAADTSAVRSRCRESSSSRHPASSRTSRAFG